MEHARESSVICAPGALEVGRNKQSSKIMLLRKQSVHDSHVPSGV